MFTGTLADPRGDTGQEITYAKEAGFDYVEISLEGPNSTLERLQPIAAQLKKTKDDLGLFYTCHTPWGWNIGNPYPKLRQATVQQVIDVIDFAEAVEAKLVTVHMHTRFGLFDRRELIKNMGSSLNLLCDRAAKSGMAITVENVDQTPEDFKKLFELEPRAKFHLDVGHANISCAGGSNILAFIEAFKDRLYHLHVHDNRGGHNVEGDLHLALGMGNIDWPRVVKALKEAGYNRTVTFEVFARNRQYLEISKDLFTDLWENV
jgi:sugar phosphate isomerase/epimerase